MKNFTNFSFWMYTDILFGKDTEKEVGAKIRQHGGTRVMIVHGGGSIKKIGLYDTIVESLNKEKIPFVELAGVKPNPLRSFALKGLKMAKKEGVDFLLGVGGGSVIDTAKAIALGLVHGCDFWDFYSGKSMPDKKVKLGAINTISAAGSETNGATVILDDIDLHLKKAITYSHILRPAFAIMNPELTYSVSAYQTAAGSADMFSHTMERFFTKSSCFLADQFASGLMRSIIKFAPIALKQPDNYEARAELMLAGSFGHNDVTGIGRSGHSFPIHSMELYISATYDTAHGAGIALLMPAWLQHVVENGSSDDLARVAQFATMVFDVQPGSYDNKDVAYEGIRRFREWNKSIGMPLTLSELNISASDIPELVNNSRYGAQGTIGGFITLDKKAVEKIFKSLI